MDDFDAVVERSWAKAVLAAAEGAACQMGLAASIAVVDCVGNLVSFQRVNNACPTSIEAAIRKARTSANLGAPTKVLEDILHGGMTSILSFEFVTASQGGLPLVVDGAVIGGIGVSGGTGEEDEAIASTGAQAISPTAGLARS